MTTDSRNRSSFFPVQFTPGANNDLFKRNYRLDSSDSDSTSNSESSDAESVNSMDRVTYWRFSQDFHLFGSCKGPYALIYKIRYALVQERYREVFLLTKELLDFASLKIKEPAKFILGESSILEYNLTYSTLSYVLKE
jgi:hypothetical protein